MPWTSNSARSACHCCDCGGNGMSPIERSDQTTLIEQDGVVAFRGSAGRPRGRPARTSCLLLGLELRVVGREELADVVGHVEQLGPLLFVERDGKSPESVYRQAALFADLHRDPLGRAFFERF